MIRRQRQPGAGARRPSQIDGVAVAVVVVGGATHARAGRLPRIEALPQLPRPRRNVFGLGGAAAGAPEVETLVAAVRIVVVLVLAGGGATPERPQAEGGARTLGVAVVAERLRMEGLEVIDQNDSKYRRKYEKTFVSTEYYYHIII